MNLKSDAIWLLIWNGISQCRLANLPSFEIEMNKCECIHVAVFAIFPTSFSNRNSLRAHPIVQPHQMTSVQKETWPGLAQTRMNFIYPGKPCRHIYDNRVSRGQSGYYWIKTDKVQEVYCDMELSCGGIRGGWMRIAKVDATQGDDCPDGWKNITSPALLCKGFLDGPGCSQHISPTTT